MEVLARIDFKNNIDLDIHDFNVVSKYTYHDYYCRTYSDDKFVIVKFRNYYYLVNNTQMYTEHSGLFNDEWNSSKHKKFSSFEEALMYATSIL